MHNQLTCCVVDDLNLFIEEFTDCSIVSCNIFSKNDLIRNEEIKESFKSIIPLTLDDTEQIKMRNSIFLKTPKVSTFSN